MAPVLAFDIETIPDVAGLRLLRGADAAASDADVYAAEIADRAARNKSDFMPLYLQRVLVISCVFRGKAGDPVYAAADGRVVYAGSGLRGYGNLVILKHNATYLTAYAHNQTLLVKDDQQVKRGQKIAEMGSTDADGVQLHFEIRKQGRPIDPARLLPAR